MSGRTNMLSRDIQSTVPKGVTLIVFIAMLLVAFFLGAVLTGGRNDRSTEEDQAVAGTDTSSTASTRWTCSMHPQIKLPDEGKCPICFMDLIPLKQDENDGVDLDQIRVSEAAMKIAAIQTHPVIRGIAESRITLFGVLDYDETRVTDVSARVSGRLDTLYADFTGANVRKGDKLAAIYSPELLSAQQELMHTYKAVQSYKTNWENAPKLPMATYQSARKKLLLLGLSDKQIAEIEENGITSTHTVIRSPVEGIVIDKHISEGSYVKTGSSVYTIASLSQLWILFDAFESDIEWLHAGQEIKFRSRAFPGETFAATVEWIDPVLDESSRSASVRARAYNIDGKLKPGMYVTGEITSSNAESSDFERDESLLIPATSPLITGRRAIVYVQTSTDDGNVTFEGREIELGPKAGDYYIVRSGLSEGEVVVTNGAFKLDSELQIQARRSMMLPSNGSDIRTSHVNHSGSGDDRFGTGIPNRMGDKPARNMDEAMPAIQTLFDAYFDIQMALANDNLKEAASAYEVFLNRCKSLEASDLPQGVYENLRDHSLAGTEAESIDNSRDAFYHLSNSIIELESSYGHLKRDYFLTFCPMARENEGAYWLQEVDTVYNSFYGSMMLRCGEIKKRLPAANLSD